MDKNKVKAEKRSRRHSRIRAKVKGNGEIPRLSVFKSNTAIYAQVIDDEKSITIASASSASGKGKSAKEVGAEVGKKAKDKGVSKVVFDRGGYIYTGKIKDLADGAREAGLIF